MSVNYYQLLKITENATLEEIQQAYAIQLKKWQQIQEQQPEQLRERTAKVINCIETAYQVLINPLQRSEYDQSLNQSSFITNTAETTMAIQASASTNNKVSSNKGYYIVIILLLIIIAAGIFYLIYKTRLIPTPPKQVAKTVVPKQTNTTQTPLSPALKEALAKAEEQKKQQAQDPTLKALAKTIAENANKNINATINYNTKFIGAKASNQNITFNLLIIDGISISKNLLTVYFNERFILDNNEICGNYEDDLTKGILYTFAYYNSKGKLLGSYYIDKQVCQSPATNKIIKRPDINQLKSIEITADTNIEKN